MARFGRSRCAHRAFPPFAKIDGEIEPGGWRNRPRHCVFRQARCHHGPVSAGIGADQGSHSPDQTLGTRLLSPRFPELPRPSGRQGTLTKAVRPLALSGAPVVEMDSAGGTGRR